MRQISKAMVNHLDPPMYSWIDVNAEVKREALCGICLGDMINFCGRRFILQRAEPLGDGETVRIGGLCLELEEEEEKSKTVGYCLACGHPCCIHAAEHMTTTREPKTAEEPNQVDIKSMVADSVSRAMAEKIDREMITLLPLSELDAKYWIEKLLKAATK